MLTTDQRGAVAESAITHAAAKLGIEVYKPIHEGGRHDLILATGSQLLHVQCKWSPRRGDVVIVRCRSSRRAREGIRHRFYTAAEVDAIATYGPDIGRCFYVPADRFAGHPEIVLRVGPSRNNQRLGVNWADDFDFAARLRALLGP